MPPFYRFRSVAQAMMSLPSKMTGIVNSWTGVVSSKSCHKARLIRHLPNLIHQISSFYIQIPGKDKDYLEILCNR